MYDVLIALPLPLQVILAGLWTVVLFRSLLVIKRVMFDTGSEGTVDRLGAEQAAQFMQNLGIPEEPHEEGSMIPCCGLVSGNDSEPCKFDNEYAHGTFLALHRATYDAQLNKSCKYPYGEYFRGKKRLWEARMQFQFKVCPKTSEFFFGIELEEYVTMGAPTKKAMKLIVSMLKRVVGNNIYHSAGDDPGRVSGELEVPAFVMPLVAIDQYIVTPPGQTPPKLTDPKIPTMGSHRVKRVKQFAKELQELEFIPGATYTFCFWGISQWLDKLNWMVRLPLANLGFNNFCGRPPVHVVFYTLKNSQDSRHLRRLKEYYFDLAFWSSKDRPPLSRIKELFGDWLKSEDGALASNTIRKRASHNDAGVGREKSGRMCCTGAR